MRRLHRDFDLRQKKHDADEEDRKETEIRRLREEVEALKETVVSRTTIRAASYSVVSLALFHFLTVYFFPGAFDTDLLLNDVTNFYSAQIIVGLLFLLFCNLNLRKFVLS